MSMTFPIFLAWASPSDPPYAVKSCANEYTRLPPMLPCPTTTPSPGIIDDSDDDMPKSWQR